jgi:putative transposase
MLAKDRAKVLFATISRHGGRWWVSLNLEAADLHPTHQHPARDPADAGCWVGVDRGLSAFLVAARADATEVARIGDAPKALRAGMRQQQRLAKSLSRRKRGSRNRRDAAARLGRHHHHVANVRRHFLHRVSGALVKTHDRLVLEDLNVKGCWPTTDSLKRSRMPGGLSSLACWAKNRRGEAATLWWQTAGVSLQQVVSSLRRHP